MRRHAAFWLPALCASLLASCETSTSIQDPHSDLHGAWALQALELASGQTIRVSDPSQYTLEFRGNEVGLRVDCNSCGGSYEISGNELQLGTLACTLAFCAEGSLDGQYMEALSSVSTFSLSGDELRIRYAMGVMRFRRS
jgi:heat shock protein HslJ